MIKKFILICCLPISILLGTDNKVQQSQSCDFSCNLEEKSNASIFLVGEEHYSHMAKTFRDALEELACKGDIYLAREGLVAGKVEGACKKEQTNPLIYGMEDKVSRTFLSGLDRYYYLVYDLAYNNDHKTILTRKLNFILAIIDDEININCWKEASKKNKDRFPKFISLIDRMIEKKQKLKKVPLVFIKTSLMGDNDFMNNLEAFIELSKAFAFEIGTWFQKELNLPDEKIKCFFDLLENPLEVENIENVASFTVKHRDVIMAQSIMKLYCEVKSSGKVIYAIMGKSHLKGIKKILDECSEGKVKIEVLDLTDMGKTEL